MVSNNRFKMFRILFSLLIMAMLPLCSKAQEEFSVVRGQCMPDAADAAGAAAHRAPQRLPAVNKQWDADRVYKQMVILFEFTDSTFQDEEPRAYYDKLFNEPGFASRHSKGCVADYFRDQSGGLFNLSFDIYGPVQVSQQAQPYDAPTATTRNYGKTSIAEAVKKVLEANPAVDYSQYDWNNDGIIEQVICIYASLPGNLSSSTYGHIWPNTSTISTVMTPDGRKISNYSCSGEHWPTKNKTRCGLGTIAHEFTHSLGLPDIYLTDGTKDNIVVDTWDLMDGGNYLDYGFCPPNYSALEKMLLGWLESVELTEPMTAEGLTYGTVYRITNTQDDYYLLENRCQTGWDEGLPGQGLVIWHVRYDAGKWTANLVNDATTKRFDLVHADGLDYYAWEDKIEKEGLGTYSPNKKGNMMNYNALSTSPFPYLPVTGDPVTSFTEVAGETVTNIRTNADGSVSFDFMGGATAVEAVLMHGAVDDGGICDLSGRRVQTPLPGRLYLVRLQDGTIRKIIYNHVK